MSAAAAPRGFPETLAQFQKLFPTDEACADYLEKLRWPDGFSCPKCAATDPPWRIKKPGVLKCSACRADISLTADTVMRSTHSELTTWFWAAYILVAQTPIVPVLQLQKELGLTRYETAYTLLQKLRHGMLLPEREPLGSVEPVQFGETIVLAGTKDGRRRKGARVFGAVEVRGAMPNEAPSHRHAGRLCLEAAANGRAAARKRFIRDHVVAGAVVDHVRPPASMIAMCFVSLEAWLQARRRPLDSKHLPAHLNEFVFRFNRRFAPMTAFNAVLGLTMRSMPADYATLYSGTWQPPSGLPAAPPIEKPFLVT